MKSEGRGVWKLNMELKLIEINVDTFFGFFNHCHSSGDLVEELCNCVNIETGEILVLFEPLTDRELF